MNKRNPLACQRRLQCCSTINNCLAAAVCVFALIMPSVSTNAEVRVRGDAGSIQIDAAHAKIGDILSELARGFGVRYRSAINVDTVVDGTYTGSLRQVLSRLLDGYTYVITNQNSRVELVVIGKTGERPIPAPQLANPASANSLAAQWRALTKPMASSLH